MPIDLKPDPAAIRVLHAPAGAGFSECLIIIASYSTTNLPGNERSDAFVIAGAGEDWQLEAAQFSLPRFGDGLLAEFAPPVDAAEMVKQSALGWATAEADRLRLARHAEPKDGSVPRARGRPTGNFQILDPQARSGAARPHPAADE
jgi:hypothetical protein